MSENENSEVFQYGDPRIASKDAPVPISLLITYITLPLWGILWWYLFWNGNAGGWFDRGHWGELQRAANTKFPVVETTEKTQNKPQALRNTENGVAVICRMNNLN